MNVDGLLFATINAAAFMLSAGFLIYVTSIVVPFLRHRPAQPGDSSGRSWHFVVPCLDEERVIEQTVARLRTDFPDGHVWCIDDASGDDTPAILHRLAGSDPHVHVVTRHLPDARVGKGPALNTAWRAIVNWLPPEVDAAEVIVGVVDADGYLDPECLRVVSGERYFGDPKVSAVQIQVRVSNEDLSPAGSSAASRILVRMQDMEFTTVIAAIQMLRHNVGSVGMGGNGQFTRLSTLNDIATKFGQPWRDALIEDFELGLHVLLTGGHNEYCHETFVAQQGPPTFLRLVRQRSRWGQGLMQCMRYLGPVLRSPKISTGAAVEITYFLFLPWMQIVGDVVYLLALVALIYAAFAVPHGPFQWLGDAGAWQLIPLFAVFGLGPLFIWGPIYRSRIAPELTRRQAVVLGLANWPYLFVHHFAVWWAFSRVVRSRHDWKKTERLDRRPAQPAVLQPALPQPALPQSALPQPGIAEPAFAEMAERAFAHAAHAGPEPAFAATAGAERAFAHAAHASADPLGVPTNGRLISRPAPVRPAKAVVGGRLRTGARPRAAVEGRLVVARPTGATRTPTGGPKPARPTSPRNGGPAPPHHGDEQGRSSRSSAQSASIHG